MADPPPRQKDSCSQLKASLRCDEEPAAVLSVQDLREESVAVAAGRAAACRIMREWRTCRVERVEVEIATAQEREVVGIAAAAVAEIAHLAAVGVASVAAAAKGWQVFVGPTEAAGKTSAVEAGLAVEQSTPAALA